MTLGDEGGVLHGRLTRLACDMLKRAFLAALLSNWFDEARDMWFHKIIFVNKNEKKYQEKKTKKNSVLHFFARFMVSGRRTSQSVQGVSCSLAVVP